MLTDKQIIEKYGQPGDTDNLTVIPLPYPMRIAWDKTKSVNKMQCHKKASAAFTGVFADLLAHYGLPELQRLEIDLFGGCYNFRLMRGSKKTYSRHSWAIAIDLSPEKNGLKTKWPQSQFYKPEYAPMHQIFEKHGFFNYGKVKGYDAMHFELSQ